jgi:S1-C subfamily serine protease
MTQETGAGLLRGISAELAGVVERVAPSVVRVDDGSRLTATGILWSADGLVVTTSHGVERDEDLAIEQAGANRLPATLVGRDPDTDLALLRVNATGLPAMQRAGADEAKVGHLALTVARPGNAGLQVTLGIISARQESQNNGQDEYLLQFDALLYPGFSGAPLVDMDGRMVGLINLMFGRGKGVALGVPIVAHTVETLLAHGRVQRGYLGVRTQLVALPATLKTALGTEQERALLLVQVEAGGPAEQGGLLMGDTLLTLNGHPIQDVETLRQQLRSLRAGQTVAVGIARGGAPQQLNVTLGAES